MESIVLEKPSSSTIHDGGGGGGGGGRAIDRHNPIIRDEKRLVQGRIFPSNSTTITTDHNQHKKPPEVEEDDQKKKSVAFANDDEFIKRIDPFMISPASSSRCLLSDKAKFNFISQFHHVLPQSPPPSPREPFNSLNENAIKTNYDDLLSSPPSPAPQLPPLPPPYESDDEPLSSSPPKPPPSPPRDQPPPSSDQVVVLEVSLHCRGCERKMKKHISKIEGVTSFKIDFAAKKVTVVGDVTPLTVLTSVLKVKNAKLLTPTTISSSPSQTESNRSQS